LSAFTWALFSSSAALESAALFDDGIPDIVYVSSFVVYQSGICIRDLFLMSSYSAPDACCMLDLPAGTPQLDLDRQHFCLDA
tara:strand:+ start:1053 stop:1298 length:246 start_codon:yes stop_codon:yes gene_type:complete